MSRHTQLSQFINSENPSRTETASQLSQFINSENKAKRKSLSTGAAEPFNLSTIPPFNPNGGAA